MNGTGKTPPEKLKHDAIVEALFEIRFEAPAIPEIFFGRLTDYSSWRGFETRRLPAADIPGIVRSIDPTFRYQPTVELVAPSNNRAVRFGPQVLSYHRTAPYVGWQQFSPELAEAIDALFAAVHGLKVHRLGLRYMNALRPDLHGIDSISALDLTLAIANRPLSGHMNLNFAIELSAETQCTVRVATPDFVLGNLPVGTAVVIDVDVFTRDTFRTADIAAVKEWIVFAHSKEKEQFFSLFTPETIASLREQ